MTLIYFMGIVFIACVLAKVMKRSGKLVMKKIDRFFDKLDM